MSCYIKADSTTFLEDMMQGNMDGIYQPFLERLPDRGIILDAGCGSGRDSLYFKNRGHMVVPMETSEEICQKAGERIGQAVLYCNYEEAHFKIPFDGIWACGSLLHFKEEKLIQVLKHFRYSLKQRGTIYTSFIYRTNEKQNGEFLNLGEKMAEEIFIAAGFDIDKMWVTEDRGREKMSINWLNILANRKD